MTEKDARPLLETAPMRAGEVGDRDSRPPHHHVLVLHLGATVERFSLQPGRPIVVGREPPADIVVSDWTVSRRHARITVAEGQVIVDDLGSRNGTYVNEERIEHAIVPIGQEIVLGDVIVSVQVSRAVDLSPTGFERHDMFVTLTDHEMRRVRVLGATGAIVVVHVIPGRETAFRRLCAQVANHLRPIDRVALYGAHEVEVLLPDLALPQAIDVARRLRAIEPDASALRAGVAALTLGAGQAEDLIASARDAARSVAAAKDIGVFAPATTTSWSSGDPASPRALVQTPGLTATLDLAKRVARAAIPVLIVGETGTGKELVARLLHESGPRASKPMVAVNCGAIPRDLLEGTLFGHEKGAFTGATQSRRGVFEAADKGTVFLDEVGELSSGAQAALLRVLETKRVTRVGSTDETPVDVRIVAATHRDLETMCAQGTFREDLLFRLNSVVIEIPPLRERRTDIAALTEHFLREANREHGRSIADIDDEAHELITSYAWPGNVRELKNAIERAVVVAAGDVIEPHDLPDRVRGGRPVSIVHTEVFSEAGPVSAPDSGHASRPPLRDAVEQYEADLLRRALEEVSWNVGEAAKKLDLPMRTLQHKMKRFGLRRPA